jgi:hypothetical protein
VDWSRRRRRAGSHRTWCVSLTAIGSSGRAPDQSRSFSQSCQAAEVCQRPIAGARRGERSSPPAGKSAPALDRGEVPILSFPMEARPALASGVADALLPSR